MNRDEGRAEIGEEGVERAGDGGAGATDDHVVPAIAGGTRQDGAGNLAQAALCTIADDGVAELLRAREPDAPALNRFGIGPLARLEEKPGRALPARLRGAEEIGPPGEHDHGIRR